MLSVRVVRPVMLLSSVVSLGIYGTHWVCFPVRISRDVAAVKFRFGFEVFAAVSMKSTIFWGVTPGNPARVRRSFGETYCFLLPSASSAYSSTFRKESERR